MRPTDDLFDLIKSLEKSEKRTFSLYASRHVRGDANNYQKLFDAIDTQSVYDESLIKEKLSGESFVKHYAFAKNYLYRLILRSLNSAQAAASPNRLLMEHLQFADTLYQKGLYAQCLKIIWKAKEMAEKYERLHLLLDIIRWELKLYTVAPGIFADQKFKVNVYRHEEETLKKLQNLNRYGQLSAELYTRSVRVGGMIRTPRERQQFVRFMRHPLLQKEDNALSYEAMEYFYYLHALYNSLREDMEESWRYRKAQADLIEAHPAVIEWEPRRYIFTLGNLMIAELYLHKRSDFFTSLQKIRSLVSRSPGTESLVFSVSYLREINFYKSHAEFQKGISLTDKIREGIEKHGKEMPDTVLLEYYFELFSVHFPMGKFKEALHWLNALFNHPGRDSRQDLQSVARLCALITHFELGNPEIIEPMLRSTYRYLVRCKRIYRTESILLEFIRKNLFRPLADDALLSAFRQLRKALAPMEQDPFEKLLFEYFDFAAWLDGKISGTLFVEILRQKVLFNERNRET